MTMTRRRIVRLAALIVAAGCLATAVAVFWPVATPDFAAVKSSHQASEAYLLDRRGMVLDSQRIDFTVRRLDWVPLEDISPALIAAIIDGEDRHFWSHHGVVWGSVLGALRDEGLRHRRRGASTITMQLASLLEKPPARRQSTATAERQDLPGAPRHQFGEALDQGTNSRGLPQSAHLSRRPAGHRGCHGPPRGKNAFQLDAAGEPGDGRLVALSVSRHHPRGRPQLCARACASRADLLRSHPADCRIAAGRLARSTHGSSRPAARPSIAQVSRSTPAHHARRRRAAAVAHATSCAINWRSSQRRMCVTVPH